MDTASTELYLIRHGQTEANTRKQFQGQNDTPLTAQGIQEAERIGRRLRQIHPQAVYASDLKRAVRTAEIAAQGLDCHIRIHEGLRERHFGVFQGQGYSEAHERYPEVWNQYRGAKPDYHIPGGESWQEFIDRIVSSLNNIAEQHRGSTIAIVTHGGVIGYFCGWLLGFSLQTGLPRLSIRNGGFTRIRQSDDGFVLMSYGDTHHMDYE